MQKLKYLQIVDVIILTIILFGQAIYSSTLSFLNTKGLGDSTLTYTSSLQNFQMIIFQGILILIALTYLYFRRFDFRQWQCQFSLRSTAIALFLFLTLAIMMDLLFFNLDENFRNALFYYPWNFSEGVKQIILQFKNFPLILYAVLNGVYEELFFIGICNYVIPKAKNLIFVLSLIIRISFHTYQGLLSAIGIGLFLGITYFWFYNNKSKNLYPIFLSHTIADILGLSIVRYFIIAV